MAGKTVDISNIISVDQLAYGLANLERTWSNLRRPWIEEGKELRQYLYATDTSKTTNNKLPWKNRTTIPKLTQINDNMLANYVAAIFPRRLWMNWLADNKKDDDVAKRDAILAYMQWATSQPQFKTEMIKCLQDFIQSGNALATVEWADQRRQLSDKIQSGYVGPLPVRLSPLDTVFNPIATSFYDTGKFVKSYLTLGEVKKKLNQMSNDENHEAYEEIFKYLVDFRKEAQGLSVGDLVVKDDALRVDGFDSYQAYLASDYVEILTYYGDVYDKENDELLENYVIMIADRHKIIKKEPNPSFFGYPPIFHCGWRVRQDNLYAMSPLTNLVGMQYRIDHVENLKADVFDLLAFPMLKIKGSVQDFEWGPMNRIYCDADSDVEIIAPAFQVLQADTQVDYYSNTMEAMAGSPKEAMGFRSPGEKTAFEVQRLENAASRIFQSKIMQFEEQFLEPLLNAMLELARRMITGPQDIAILNDELNIQTFMTLTSDDITGAGRIKPIGARHFAEKAEMVQNVSGMVQSGIFQDQLFRQHWSSIKMAKMYEELLGLKDYELVTENIALSEQQQAQRLSSIGQEQTEMALQTSGGFHPDDYDLPPGS